ncbi:hypothetical protein AGABI2DRAFT_225554 [Agaricus bisporus var. bisporus H97]|uniref:hypothetical protein n=1 Tax=Agaricus bisporus var. bisporus (strain H97 / ATCC MYA-4626 / FGSC 10389) TaxID=936046 RepID=UPI00029F6578|nr:hypothetical protein AGABI2DRAFT_225554 [Agaricus bisporus var. bisporus H97]EKV44349.1 hypothetical protein AGABI2DRAFT_225554 [Agaricus bisporus var. bisporus H97]
MSPLQPAFHSYSVPTSPAVSRSFRNTPVTPQRVSRQQHRHTQSFHQSPITPLTPYTPLSFHSSDSNLSSTLTTPDNSSSNPRKRIHFIQGSPEFSRAPKGISDVADNWRSRSDEDSIRGSSTDTNAGEDTYGDDDGAEFSVSDLGNGSNVVNSDALLPPFLSKQMEYPANPASSRPRSQSQNIFVPQTQPLSPTLRRNGSRLQSPVSPLRTRQSQNTPPNLLTTPPPNRNLVKQLKLKGSLTDPAHTRRREAFGVVRTPQNAHTSLNLGHLNDVPELFDINEHEYEHDTNHDISFEDESFSLNLQAHQMNTFGYINSDYPSFPQYNSDPFQSTGIQSGYTNIPSISDSVEHHFHSFRQQQRHHNPHNYDFNSNQGHRHASLQPQSTSTFPSYVKPARVPIPTADLSLPIIHKPTAFQPSRRSHSMTLPPAPDSIFQDPPSNASDCSVCLCQNASSLAVLKPCGHPLCSACLTSALNIVGEKDMECAVCKQGVQDFKLVNPNNRSNTIPDARRESLKGTSFFDPILSSPSSTDTADGINTPSDNDGFGDIDSGFDFGIEFSPNEIRASTPKLENSTSFENNSHSSGKVTSKNGFVVLRVDNVPWDITPSQVIAWLQQPVERVHVLLDSKGKTLSHAYVEVKDQKIAGSILRGEAISSDHQKKERGSVLGRGRRARGVTITRSSQEELMADLFPRWRGSFDCIKPSLAGLQGDRIISALEGGVLTENEVTGLLYLIREPDSHFLKVPSLPFHSLISILSKFPSDIDSRVFWSATIRDMLFDVTIAAIETLLTRLERLKDGACDKVRIEHGYSMDLVVDLVQTALQCQAFTGQQTNKLVSFASFKSIPIATSIAAFSQEPALSCGAKHVAHSHGEAKDQTGECFGDLAREFGVEAELVQALAQRLANLA